jgi:hypothetical protein
MGDDKSGGVGQVFFGGYQGEQVLAYVQLSACIK